MMTGISFDLAIQIIMEKGTGLHKITDDFYVFAESWDVICVEKECEGLSGSEFDECAFSHAEWVTFEVIPKELEEEGFEVIESRLVDIGDAPYGTSIVLLRRR